MKPLFGVFPVPEAERQDAVVEQVLLADRLGLDLVGIQDHPYQRRHLDAWTLISYLAGPHRAGALLPRRREPAAAPPRRAGQVGGDARPPERRAGRARPRRRRVLGGHRRVGRAGADGAGVRRRARGGDRDHPPRVGGASAASTAEGEHYRMHGAHGGPAPAHDIGIWLGAYGPRMVRIVGRLADGWVPSLPRLPLEEVPGRQDAIDEAARKAGRDPAKIRRVANLNGVIADGDGWLRGPAEHWVEELDEARARPALRRLRGVVRPRGPARADRAVRDRGRSAACATRLAG